MMTQNDEKNSDLLLSSYQYELPQKLIADRPSKRRDHSRLMVYDQKSDQVTHAFFHQLPEFLPKDSLLVLNQSKVFPCRLLGKKKTGGKAEIFLLSVDKKDGGYPALIRTTNKKHLGDEFFFDQDITAKIVHIDDDGTFEVDFNLPLEEVLSSIGKVPIPPYIRGGESDQADLTDYQTTYAKHTGSVAAPTAGLHFTEDVFKNLNEKGIDRALVTLHVGMGTFAPVKSANITDHKMHSENYFIEKDDLAKIKEHQNVFAVGTTSLRVLESSYGKQIEPGKYYSTDIFLHPGVEVKSIKGMVTNFHLPGSSLIMLVSSLIGREKTMELYKIAVEKEYRFFSYGDAMLILRDQS